VSLISFVTNVVNPWVKSRINAKSDVGASLVEYALLVALIAVFCIVGIGFLGGKANDKFNTTGSALN